MSQIRWSYPPISEVTPDEWEGSQAWMCRLGRCFCADPEKCDKRKNCKKVYHSEDRMKKTSMKAAPKGRIPAIRMVNGACMYLGNDPQK